MPDPVDWDDLRLVHASGVRRSGGERARCRPRRSGGSAFPGRPRWSSGRDGRSARRSPPRGDVTGRRRPDRRRTSPAAPITPSAIAARATACSTTSRSPRASCSATARSRASRSSTATSTRATAPRRSSATTARVHVLAARREELSVPQGVERPRRHFEDGAGDDEYLAALATHLPRVLDGQQPELVFYLAGADPYEGDRLGRLSSPSTGCARATRSCSTRAATATCRSSVAMSGGYAPDVEAIVTIHANTIKEAKERVCRSSTKARKRRRSP